MSRDDRGEMPMDDIQFIKYSHDFLELSKKWLSDPEIKRLTMTPDIQEEEQERWFHGLEQRKDYFIRGITADGNLIGAVGIKHIDFQERTGEYWGYIGEKQYIGRGIGKLMVTQMCREGKKMNLDILYLKVAEYNVRAYQLYLKQGFMKKYEIDGTIYMFKRIDG